MEKTRKSFKMNTKSRIMSAVVVVFLLFFYLIGRLAYLQIVKNDYYSSLASSQQLRDTLISAKRGTIYDANMNILARSATVWTVAVTPNNIDAEEAQKIASFLSEKLDVDRDDVLELCSGSGYYSIVKRKVDKPVVDEIQAFMKEQKVGGITFTEDSKRYYPYGSFASQILGFVGTDNNGLYGLESFYESYLAGTSGRLFTAVNANGTNVYYEYETVTEAKDGYSLRLTLDAEIQKYLEDALEAACAEHHVSNFACGIVMDVNDGAILGMAVKPDFDPNDPLTITDEQVLESLAQIENRDEYLSALGLAQQNQWRNRCISDLYEPGSVFKVVTASAILETGTFGTEDTFYCPGYYRVTNNISMYCAHHEGHGEESFSDAVVNSCNPAFIQMGLALGKEQFYNYFRAFGLNEKTGVDLPSETGSIYYDDASMGVVELASCSYGQSNAISPLQMITAFSAVVNGGNLVQPYIVREILDADGNVVQATKPNVKRQVISAETSATMCGILEQVVENANGQNAYVAGFRMGGKSGTGEKLGGKEDEYVASFCAFAPADDPEIACLILLDGAHSYSIYGGVIVAPVVAKVMSQVLPYLGVEAVYSENELANVDVYVPNVRDYSLTNAYAALQKKGLEYEVVGSGTAVLRTFPVSGTSVPKGSRIWLYTDEESAERTVEMPAVTGYDLSYVRSLFSSLGLNLKVSGAFGSGAIAVTQSVAEGATVPEGTVVTVDFVDTSIND